MESAPDTVKELVQSKRKDIAQGAAELRLDDFVETFLRESHPEDALAAPSLPEPPTVPRPASGPPRPGAPTKTVKMQALAPRQPSGTMSTQAIAEAQPLPQPAQGRLPTPMPPTLPTPMPPTLPTPMPPTFPTPMPPTLPTPMPATFPTQMPPTFPTQMPMPAAGFMAPAPALEPASRAPLFAALGLALLLACGGIAFLVLGPQRDAVGPSQGVDAAKTAPTSTATSVAAPAPARTTAVASETSTAAAAPAPSETAAAPADAATSLPSATASAAPAPSGAPPSTEPAEGLLSFQAYLTVESTPGLEVVVQGVVVGHTNEKNLVRCGPRNVRLREPKGGRFRTPGQATQLTCMTHVKMSLAADP